MHGKIAVLLATLSLAILSSACGSPSTSAPVTTTTAPTTLAAACTQLTNIQKSEAGAAFGDQGFVFGAHPTTDSAKAYAVAARNLSRVLSKASWPTAIRSNARSLANALSTLSTTLDAYDGSSSKLTMANAQSKVVGRLGSALERSMSCASAF